MSELSVFFAALFGPDTIPATSVDGVSIPSFKAPAALVYVVSHVEGANWETKVIAPMITAIRADGASAEETAIEEATAVINEGVNSVIKNELLDGILEAGIDAEINSLLSTVFTTVEAAVNPPAAP